ncbi:MAG: hypothetical protein HYX68_23625 [Planctomycetes bacterium]|nr:hypothetical protein [Planctomycetota bacterium]
MMARADQILSWLFTVTGVTALGVAGYFYWTELPVGPALEFEAVELELNDSGPGQQREVAFQFHNRSGKPMRLLGLSEC